MGVLFHNNHMEKYYYLDNAATTKPFDEEFDLLKENNAEGFFNPSLMQNQLM